MPPLGNARILLRPPTMADAAALYAAVRESIDTISPWMAWCHEGYGKADSDSWIARCEGAWRDELGDREFGIFDARSGLILGCAGVNQINRLNRFANLGYWVRKSRVGEGIASESAAILAHYALRDLGLVRVEIVARVDNVASRRVAEKAGFHRESVARSRLMHGGRAHDAAIYSLVASDVLLERYGAEPHEREVERVRAAIVKLAGNDLEKMRYLVDVARRDYRDVLFWADNPNEAKLDTPEKRRRVREAFEKLGIPVPPQLKE